MSARPRSLALVGGLVLSVALLAGCAGGAGSPAPDASADEAEISAAWLDGGAMVGLLMHGSSSCVPYADDVSYADGVLEVSLAEPDRPCTRDFVLRGVPVSVPDGVNAAEDLRIEVSGPGYTAAVELPGASGLERGSGLEAGQPSAGWAGPETLALLTWGSSSCPPEVEDAMATAAGEITVTFVAPDPDRVCTADMGPRITPVAVTGATPGETYEAVLNAPDAEPTRIPVAGTP